MRSVCLNVMRTLYRFLPELTNAQRDQAVSLANTFGDGTVRSGDRGMLKNRVRTRWADVVYRYVHYRRGLL